MPCPLKRGQLPIVSNAALFLVPDGFGQQLCYPGYSFGYPFLCLHIPQFTSIRNPS